MNAALPLYFLPVWIGLNQPPFEKEGLVLYSVVKAELRQLHRIQNLIVWTRVGNEDKIEGLSPFLFVKRVDIHVAQAEGKLYQWLIKQQSCDKI